MLFRGTDSFALMVQDLNVSQGRRVDHTSLAVRRSFGRGDEGWEEEFGEIEMACGDVNEV